MCACVEYWNNQVVISTCRMCFYIFPFDIQSGNISFKSIMQSEEAGDGETFEKVCSYQDVLNHLNLTKANELFSMTRPVKDYRRPTEVFLKVLLYAILDVITTKWSRELMRTQYEWLLVDMTVINKTVSPFGAEQDTIIYTISMKRRSVLYIANFLLPVLFFLCLDLASFLISDRGGEKLSFKVTVLLAVTVMQLILYEILPSSSDKIPLIAVYCIGIFALMMLSLLETILVMHLMEKDSQDNESMRAKLWKNKAEQ
ncbi:5-hydroxytryptamine receptor 3E-like [Melanotaenia boesemani]|uniref:5-hydroxytryptamine receptor 3E-like n=1 Tax=Melanotaenia boesemani TaxID=1250792 RepID=UPI001C03D9CA|nr:5-hydroxytryptamine receptor 3E-like [Melanotaenia boesemani]